MFVFLDEVAYPRAGSSGMGSWVNRVRIAIQGRPQWITCPLRRYSGVQLINDVQIDNSVPWRAKLARTLEMNYRKAPRFEEAIEILRSLIESEARKISDFNIAAIQKLADVFGLVCEFRRQSEMAAEGSGTELLAKLTRGANCAIYMCGGGAAEYQQDELFPNFGIELRYQVFEPQPYGNPETFVPGLSVIDYLMHAGPVWPGD